MAELRKRGADGTFRLHQSRHYDFGTGRRLGHDDHVFGVARPARPDWMDRATYLATPKTMEAREARFRVDRAGYRSREIIVAATLLDAGACGKEDLADLYGHRWRVEIIHPDYRSSDKLGWSLGPACPGGVRLATTRPVASFLLHQDARRHHMSAPRRRPSAPKN